MVLDASLLNTQHYKVRIKSKVEWSREWSSALSVVPIEKGVFGSPTTKVANFTLPYRKNDNWTSYKGEMLVLDSNTWDHLTVYKQMIYNE